MEKSTSKSRPAREHRPHKKRPRASKRAAGCSKEAGGATSGATTRNAASLVARLRRFLGSRIAWAAVIPVACAAGYAWGFSLITFALPIYVLLSLCAMTELLRLNRALATYYTDSAARVDELEAIVSIDALPLHEQEAIQHARDEARRTAELAADYARFVPIPFLSRATDDSTAPVSTRRESRRLAQELLNSNLGPVLDLSHGGARVHLTSRRTAPGPVDLELKLDGQPLTLSAEVVWTSNRSGRREAGLRFLRLSREQSSAITRICMQHRKCTEFAA